MTEKNLNNLIEKINELLKGGEKIFLYNEHGKYHLKMKTNNKYNQYKVLTPNANEREIFFFLSGMFQTLEMIRKRKI